MSEDIAAAPKGRAGTGVLVYIVLVSAAYAGITVWKYISPSAPRPSAAQAAPAPSQAAAPPAAAAIQWSTGTAVSFNGVSDYASFGMPAGEDAALDGLHPASVSLWFKRGQLRGDALFIKGADPFMSMAHFDAAQPERLVFYFKRGSDPASIRVYSEGFSEVGRWVHLCVTYDGSGKAAGVAVYKNGELQQLAALNDGLDGPVENPGPVLLGAYRSAKGPEWFFDGKLAGFRVDGRQLPGEEITAMAAAAPSEE